MSEVMQYLYAADGQDRICRSKKLASRTPIQDLLYPIIQGQVLALKSTPCLQGSLRRTFLRPSFK